MGERLVPASLGWLREPHEGWSMRDRLTHEYPDRPGLRFATVLATISAAQDLVDAYQRWNLKLPA